MKLYVLFPDNFIVGKTYNELKIDVDYQKGGMNYFSGNSSPSGVYVFLKPVCRGSGFEQSTMLGDIKESGFKVLLENINRKSQKKIDFWAEKIKNKLPEIARYYANGDYQILGEFVKQ